MQINTLFLLRFLVILNLMFLVQSYPSMAASPEKRVALVIGNSAYQNTPPLANPRNDATEMGNVLKAASSSPPQPLLIPPFPRRHYDG